MCVTVLEYDSDKDKEDEELEEPELWEEVESLLSLWNTEKKIRNREMIELKKCMKRRGWTSVDRLRMLSVDSITKFEINEFVQKQLTQWLNQNEF